MVLVYERHITSCDLGFHSLQGKENILSIKINRGLYVGRFYRYRRIEPTASLMIWKLNAGYLGEAHCSTEKSMVNQQN
jgi:hypothetical protein